MRTWPQGQRWKRLVLALTGTLLLVVAGACAERSIAGISRPDFASRFPERARSLQTASESGILRSETNFEGSTCSIGSVACGTVVTMYYPNAWGHSWEHYAETFFKAPGVTGQLGHAGEAFIKRGSIFAGSSGISSMNCFHLNAHNCPTTRTFDSTCSTEMNYTLAAVAHTAHHLSRVYTGTNVDHGFCAAPPAEEEECEEGEGEGDGEWEESVTSAAMIDPEDPATVAALEDGDIAFDCEPSSGGGGTTYEICWEEFWLIEISYDGGQTWNTLYAGFVAICIEVEEE